MEEISHYACDIYNIMMDPANLEKLLANSLNILPGPMKSHKWIFPCNVLPHYVGQIAGP